MTTFGPINANRFTLANLFQKYCKFSSSRRWSVAGIFASNPAKLRTLIFLLNRLANIPQSKERCILARTFVILSNIESPVYSLALHVSGIPFSEPDYNKLRAEIRRWSGNLPYVEDPSSIKPFLRRTDGLRILISPFQHKFNPKKCKSTYGIMLNRVQF